jgi:hypothetical protein
VNGAASFKELSVVSSQCEEVTQQSRSAAGSLPGRSSNVKDISRIVTPRDPRG